MKPFTLILSALVLSAASAVPAHAAVMLSNLTHPTLQTLIGLGSDGVTVGDERFYDFTFGGASTGLPSPADVAVEPVTSDGDGLMFVAGWFASGGNSLANTITFQVAVDAPAQIGRVTLLSSSVIPSPSAGTFVSTSLSTRSLSDVPVAPMLATFADGVALSTDSASSDFVPQSDLMITDSIAATSTAGGVADISSIENTFTTVPEPGSSAWLFIPAAVVAAKLLRGRRIESCTRRSVDL